MITDRIRPHKVLLQLIKTMTKFEKQSSHRLNVFMNENVTVDFFVGENEPIYITARANDATVQLHRHDAYTVLLV